TGNTGSASDSAAEQARFNALPEIKAIDAEIEHVKADCERQLKLLPPVPAEPRKPVKANPARKHFNIDIKPSEFPEMVQFKSMDFEIDGDNKKAVGDDIFDGDWEDIKLSEGTKKGVNYYVTLARNGSSVNFLVHPVFEAKDYDKAMADFKTGFKKYEEMRTARLTVEGQIKAETEARMAEERKKIEAIAQQRKVDMEKSGDVLRLFQVSGFGIYNCDSPQLFPSGVNASVRLVDEKGELLLSSCAYLVDHSRNGLFNFYQASIPQFRFNPQSKNMLWTVANAKLYILRNDGFKSIQDHKSQDVKMEAVDREFKTADEMKAYMGI
ncbi:MAG TPA: hypothetical protein VNZ86_07075, partial [Bacteroidia bacterium]|nr:hypothetical protein [Bacteroidia bacterium]